VSKRTLKDSSSAAKAEKQSTGGGGAGSHLPLPTLLSQVLVAFTIELDNEFEHRSPHRTSTSKSAPEARNAPWLTSLVMYSNLMRLVGEEGITVGELQRLARTSRLSLAGMERWGYILVEPAVDSRRGKPARPDCVVRPTAKGLRAREVWRPLFGVIENRWRERFGDDEIGALQESLSALVGRLDLELPEYLPVLGYGMVAEVYRRGSGGRVGDSGVVNTLHLPALLSKLLLAFTIEFERESDVSLAISANVLRPLGEGAVRVRDLPRLSGVSKEAIKMSVGFLERRGYVIVEPDPSGNPAKLVRLTPKGRQAHDACRQLLGVIEDRWRARFGEDAIRTLRESLKRLVGEPTADLSPLLRGLAPYPDGWRASVRKPDTLPHYPMVLHRGGYPDGS
jgi:DNA-binding MarR family transcriptional regulator